MPKEEGGQGTLVRSLDTFDLFSLLVKAATLTIAQGFSLAYQSWQLATREKRAEFRQESRLRGARDGVEGDIPGTILIEVGWLSIWFNIYQAAILYLIRLRLKVTLNLREPAI